jgi:hypothetical protein
MGLGFVFTPMTWLMDGLNGLLRFVLTNILVDLGLTTNGGNHECFVERWGDDQGRSLQKAFMF